MIFFKYARPSILSTAICWFRRDWELVDRSFESVSLYLTPPSGQRLLRPPAGLVVLNIIFFASDLFVGTNSKDEELRLDKQECLKYFLYSF